MKKNMYNPDKHHRRSIRLKGYDYSQAGRYFITLCVQDRIHLFGKIINGEMELNSIGEIAKTEWEQTPKIRKNTSIGSFIIMPNHLHGIIHIDYQFKSEESHPEKFQSPSHTIGAIIRGYKGSTTKKIKKTIGTGEWPFAPTVQIIDPSKSIWQRDYWDHIIRDENTYQRIEQYIINNPQKWEEDKLNKRQGNILSEPLLLYGLEEWMI